MTQAMHTYLDAQPWAAKAWLEGSMTWTYLYDLGEAWKREAAL